MRLLRPFFATALVVAPLAVSAISFPDVPSTYPHKAAIEALAGYGVIGGNPDGTFGPRNPVDRASMLKMLYKAAGITPDSKKIKCMSDVVAGSWYEIYVCDAVARGYVSGYTEGGVKLFKPARPVSRAEALKLTVTILGIPAADAGAKVTMYTDVKPADWFAPFVRTAVAKKILPIAGQDGTLYMPSVPMERGEAAAYIHNGLTAKGIVTAPASSSAPASSAPSSVGSQSSRKRVEDTPSTTVVLEKAFPFTDRRTVDGTKPLVFRFTLSEAQTGDFKLSTDMKNGRVTCRLYRIAPSGFSTEYYLGMEEGQECHLKVAMTSGDWQLQAQSTVAGATISVEAKPGTGDGNDGFSQAKPLERRKVKTDLLDSNDLGDWFTFKVTKDTSINTVPGVEMTVKLVSSATLGCIVYPLEDVDLFGFEGPECNALYKFPVGTYMVNVRHPVPRSGKEAYTIELQ